MTVTVAIVGGGFCGTVLAVQLLRRRGGIPLHVVLVNRYGRLARGVAYGSRTENHVLNVPAGRMGAFPDDEADFLRYVRRRHPEVEANAFVPRRWYGEYLEWLLREAVAAKPPEVQFSHYVGHAVDLETNSAGFTLWLEDGSRLCADRVVLALGNFTPADPLPPERSCGGSARYVADPWLPGALDGVDTAAPVLLIGTGLTAVDVALDLAARGQRAPIIALSRRGLSPQPHRGLPEQPGAVVLPSPLVPGRPSARAYLRALRRCVAAHRASGGDWRDVLAALRPLTPSLWRALDQVERARFLRHLQVYWDIHRHRLAPDLASRLSALQANGLLSLRAGRLQALEETADGLLARFRPRGSTATETLSVGAAINCTGPDNNTRRLREPLLDAMERRGLLRVETMGLGIELTPEYRLVSRERWGVTGLYYVGPFLKAQHWEATAVPELRVHVERLARVLDEDLRGMAI